MVYPTQINFSKVQNQGCENAENQVNPWQKQAVLLIEVMAQSRVSYLKREGSKLFKVATDKFKPDRFKISQWYPFESY